MNDKFEVYCTWVLVVIVFFIVFVAIVSVMDALGILP